MQASGGKIKIRDWGLVRALNTKGAKCREGKSGSRGIKPESMGSPIPLAGGSSTRSVFCLPFEQAVDLLHLFRR